MSESIEFEIGRAIMGWEKEMMSSEIKSSLPAQNFQLKWIEN